MRLLKSFSLKVIMAFFTFHFGLIDDFKKDSVLLGASITPIWITDQEIIQARDLPTPPSTSVNDVHPWDIVPDQLARLLDLYEKEKKSRYLDAFISFGEWLIPELAVRKDEFIRNELVSGVLIQPKIKGWKSHITSKPCGIEYVNPEITGVYGEPLSRFVSLVISQSISSPGSVSQIHLQKAQAYFKDLDGFEYGATGQKIGQGVLDYFDSYEWVDCEKIPARVDCKVDGISLKGGFYTFPKKFFEKLKEKSDLLKCKPGSQYAKSNGTLEWDTDIVSPASWTWKRFQDDVGVGHLGLGRALPYGQLSTLGRIILNLSKIHTNSQRRKDLEYRAKKIAIFIIEGMKTVTLGNGLLGTKWYYQNNRWSVEDFGHGSLVIAFLSDFYKMFSNSAIVTKDTLTKIANTIAVQVFTNPIPDPLASSVRVGVPSNISNLDYPKGFLRFRLDGTDQNEIIHWSAEIDQDELTPLPNLNNKNLELSNIAYSCVQPGSENRHHIAQNACKNLISLSQFSQNSGDIFKKVYNICKGIYFLGKGRDFKNEYFPPQNACYNDLATSRLLLYYRANFDQ